MQALGSQLHGLLHDTILRTQPGLFSVTRDGIVRVWTATQAKGKAPPWKRCSEFLNSTGPKFHIKSSADVPSQDEYNANIFVPLFFDLGFSVSMPEWRDFLQRNANSFKQRPEEALVQHATGEAEIEVSHGSSARAPLQNAVVVSPGMQIASGDADGEPQLPAAQVVGRRKRLRLQRAAYSSMASQCEEHREREPSGQDDADLDMSHVLGMLKQKDKRIAKLQSDKKKLQQLLRRAQARMAKQTAAHHEQVQALTACKDFDLQRRTENWEGKRKWSWLTSTGQINVAVPWLSESRMSFMYVFLKAHGSQAS